MKRVTIAAALTAMAAVILPATAASASPVQAGGHAGATVAASTLENWDSITDLQIQNMNTGKCLDDSSYGLRTFTCANYNYNGGWQHWRVIARTTDGRWAQLQNVATGLCLDYSAGAGLRAIGCGNYNFANGWQAWEIWERYTGTQVSVFERVFQNGRVSDGNNCLDDSSAGVRGYPCNGQSQDNLFQGWRFLILNVA